MEFLGDEKNIMLVAILGLSFVIFCGFFCFMCCCKKKVPDSLDDDDANGNRGIQMRSQRREEDKRDFNLIKRQLISGVTSNLKNEIFTNQRTENY